MNELLIREATPADSGGIALVHVRTWQHAYRGQVPDSYLDGLSVERRAAQWENIFARLAPHASVFVAERDGQVIGFCAVGPSRDADAEPTIGELYTIYVLPEQMGQGVGSALMHQGLIQLRAAGFRKAILWVLTTNRRARQFYEQKGWISDGTVKTEPRDDFELHETLYTFDL